ncbi:AIM24 family protein [Rhodococcus ruber]|uniref:AIM24 family protein n=1 Tax=Rhodococcus TaxID=1827 RepID=UPI001FD945A2
MHRSGHRLRASVRGETVSVVLNPSHLVGSDNLPGNHYAFCIDLQSPWFLSKGAMIAYYGQVQFTSLTHGLQGQLLQMVAHQFSAPLYMGDYVVAEGYGKLILGDRGYDINSYDLDDGNLTIRAANLLAFEPGLSLNQSIVPGFLTLIGTGKFLASSNGPVMFAEPPLRVDPEALVGWADCPSPSHHYDEAWVNGFVAAGARMFGVQSGEERQFDFTGAGTVLVQSSEKVIDDSAVVRTIEGQLPGLTPGGLQRINQVVASQLQSQQH